MCCDVSWSCKASKENKQRARMVVKVRVQVIIGWVCGIGECAGISLSEIRLANMCVDMSLPMHFNKFMVAIKQIVTTFLCVCGVFGMFLCLIHYFVGTCVAFTKKNEFLWLMPDADLFHNDKMPWYFFLFSLFSMRAFAWQTLRKRTFKLQLKTAYLTVFTHIFR